MWLQLPIICNVREAVQQDMEGVLAVLLSRGCKPFEEVGEINNHPRNLEPFRGKMRSGKGQEGLLLVGIIKARGHVHPGDSQASIP